MPSRSSVSGTRESSSSSTITRQVSSVRSNAMTLSASRPVSSASWRRACCASCTPDSRPCREGCRSRSELPSPSGLLCLRVSSSSPTLSTCLPLGGRLCAIHPLLDDLAFQLLSLLLFEFALLAGLLDLFDLLHARPGAVLLARDLLGDLLGHPDRETHGRGRKK